MSIQKKFGTNLRTKRLDNGLSQERLSEISGLHRTYVGAVERGERNLSLQSINKLAKALNISLSDLFKGL